MMTINKIEVIELFEEITQLSDDDIQYAKENSSLSGYENDLELYISVAKGLFKDLEYLEEYELCHELKLFLNKVVTPVD